MLNLNTPLRSLQLVLALITIGLNGYVSQWYIAHTVTYATPGSTAYLIVVGALTILALPYLFLNPALSQTHHGRQSGRFFNKYAVLAIDAVLCLMWLVGFADLAAFQHRLIICGGHVCQVMVGGIVVGAMAW